MKSKLIILFILLTNIAVGQDIVTMTVYTPNCKGCNLTTASGDTINKNNPYKHRWIAVSPDLAKKYPFGTHVRLERAGFYNGVYTVKDRMPKKWRKRIDVLVGRKKPKIIRKKVKMTKL
jgi:3D (Asp-Asp-Asp) domain-containing protein